MGKEDICFISAVEMKEKICDQEISSSELVEIIIDRIERVNPIINAICTPTLDLARQLAKKADDRVKKGEKLPPLNGIPTSIKDLMMTKGIRTTYGSKIHENYIPDVNDVAVERLLNAGIVMLGKTNTPEFGYAGVTHNKVFGITKNPWNLEKNPGGSSGGAAAAVASGISPLALGSDGGGSLRHPACFCGVFAIKPSFGRIPVYPTIGMGGETITHYGPIARYVKDAALMLDVMKGPHEADRYTIPAQDINYVDKIDELPDKLKIGYSLNLGYAKVIDPEVERSIRDSVQRFSKMDWGVEEVKLKMRNPETGYYIWYTSMYGYDFKGKVKKWRDEMDPNLVKLVEGGMTGSSLDIFKALHE
ncbi:MAG: amidase, partial [Candidatus Hodarchaeota archaeon]